MSRSPDREGHACGGHREGSCPGRRHAELAIAPRTAPGPTNLGHACRGDGYLVCPRWRSPEGLPRSSAGETARFRKRTDRGFQRPISHRCIPRGYHNRNWGSIPPRRRNTGRLPWAQGRHHCLEHQRQPSVLRRRRPALSRPRGHRRLPCDLSFHRRSCQG